MQGYDIQSYDIPRLQHDYHHMSRQWLYDMVMQWLDVCAGKAESSGTDIKASRAFLLLAGPGMGKSVFSAAMHTKLTVRADLKQDIILVRRTWGASRRATGISA